jgi:hypothetical protein
MVELKTAVIGKIIKLEWDLFQEVPHQGGPAPCQQERKTFETMRSCQAMSWSMPALKSYLQDLTQAREDGRNLLTEKYARMMENTAPKDYAAISHLLPALDPETQGIIDEIVDTVMRWELSLAKQYPNIFKRGRPLFSSSDTETVTSVETYLRGELATYSTNTLRLYQANINEQVSQGINGSAITLAQMMAAYGYDSLEEADNKLNSKP